MISVPTMLMSTTATQYTGGTYFRVANWTPSAIRSSALITYVVLLSPRLRLELRLSAPVSPTVVERTLITQKYSVTSGTLFSILRMRPQGGRRHLNAA